MSKIVNVIINTRLDSAETIFTYLADMDNIEIGQIVLVPFGTRKLYGVICEFKAAKPAYRLKKIIEIVLQKPIISQTQIKLAKFISDHYACTLGNALFAMIPVFLTGSIQKQYLIVDKKSSNQKNITTQDKQLLSFFLQNPSLKITDHILRKKFGKSYFSVLSKLIKQGCIRYHYQIKPPISNAKEIEMISIEHTNLTDKVIKNIRKYEKQWNLYCYLADHPKIDWPTVKQELNISRQVLFSLQKKNIISIEKQRIFRNPIKESKSSSILPKLNDYQEKIIDDLTNSFPANHKPHLIFGRTGSGKTEIYLRMTEHALSQGKDVIVLVPEIALVPQTMQRFFERFGSLLAIYHSNMSSGEKFDEWYRMFEGKAKIVIGSRSALFSPLKNIGLIIIDEEHESSFKQDSTPRYHAVDVACEYSRLLPAQLILGSATPRLETFWHAKKDDYKLHTISTTVYETINPECARRPNFSIVDLRDEFIRKNYSLISYQLGNEISQALSEKKQILLFLNRRGHASYVFCRECGYVARCPNCSISLTHHLYGQYHKLICHHCGFQQNEIKSCPDCSSEAIKYYGAGTQKLEEEIKFMFPHARVLRMDRDTTTRKNSHQRIFEQFRSFQADILIGTQMIAKGWDIPNVDLAGIVNADAGFHLPDFRSTERNFALLLQLIGRVGRYQSTGRVVIQTYEPENPLFDILTKEDYQLFAYSELIERKKTYFPPFADIIRLLYTHTDEKKCRQESLKVFSKLNQLFLDQKTKDLLEILGPSPAFIPRLHGKFRWHILLKGKNLHRFIKPVPLADWVIDVDPYSLL